MQGMGQLERGLVHMGDNIAKDLGKTGKAVDTMQLPVDGLEIEFIADAEDHFLPHNSQMVTFPL
jgi:hypothetical protein